MPRLEPAILDSAPDGTPWSPRYGDVYHSADSGPGQARHVFLGGNGLPERWRGREAFVVLETGFGLGVNFLATWDAWLARRASRPRRLDYVAIEKHPLLRDDLAAALARYAEFADLAAMLVDRWPAPLPGTHRRDFGGIALTLVLDDVASALGRLEAEADAVYLDGFAPARNPDMWSPAAMRGVARRMRPGATCATWSSARTVRDALAEAGVACETRPGFGHKREMLVGRLVRLARRRAASPPGSSPGASATRSSSGPGSRAPRPPPAFRRADGEPRSSRRPIVRRRAPRRCGREASTRSSRVTTAGSRGFRARPSCTCSTRGVSSSIAERGSRGSAAAYCSSRGGTGTTRRRSPRSTRWLSRPRSSATSTPARRAH